MCTRKATLPKAPPVEVRVIMLRGGRLTHSARLSSGYHTLCGIDLQTRHYGYVPPPVTCSKCLQAWGCLPREV